MCVCSGVSGSGLQPARFLLSMGFLRHDYWSGLPFPPPGDVPDPGTEFASPVSPALACRFPTTEPAGKPPVYLYSIIKENAH